MADETEVSGSVREDGSPPDSDAAPIQDQPTARVTPDGSQVGDPSQQLTSQLVGDRVPAQDRIAMRRALDQSEAMSTALNIWRIQVELEWGMRKRVGGWLVGTFMFQVLIAFLLIILVGRHWLQIPQWAMTALFVGVFSELAFMLHQIVKYLFTDRVSEPLGKVLAGLFREPDQKEHRGT